MKTKEELNTLKEEVETMSRKLAELSEDELKQVAGGVNPVHKLSDDELQQVAGDITLDPVKMRISPSLKNTPSCPKDALK